MGAGSGRGSLYVVATPIGNLEDITLRAIKSLRSVDLIAAEDTRRTRILLAHYRIDARLITYHDHNEDRQARAIIAALSGGSDVALVSDAGTPGISDPGYRVLSLAAAQGFTIIPVPGPSAVTAALSAAALPADRFTFIGFLSRQKKRRRQQLQEIALLEGAVVLYEAARRLKGTLSELAAACGPDRRAVIVREVTKAFEEVTRGTLGQLERDLGSVRGEITLVVDGASGPPADGDRPQWPVHTEVSLLESWGMDRSEAIRRVARGHGVPKSAVYRAVIESRDEE